MSADTSSLDPMKTDPIRVGGGEVAPSAASLTGEWRAFRDFVKRPVLPERAAPFRWSSLSAVGRMWALDIVLMSALVAIAMIIVAVGVDLPENALGKLEWNVQTFGLILLFAPISEEILFRSWLSGKAGHLLAVLILGASVWGAARLGTAQTPASAIGALAVMFVGGAVALALGWKGSKSPPLGWFQRLFPVFFWLSTLAFALIHLVNYTGDDSLGMLLPFVIPQFIAGAIFAYMRVHYGLWSSMLQHFLHNATAVTAALLAGEFATK